MAVRFKGDPIPAETGTGRGPEIPLSKAVQPTQVEMLNGAEQDDFEDDDADDAQEPKPEYTRERTAARIGTPLEEAQQVVEVERALDEDDVVPMIFSKPLSLQDKGLMHHWGAGVHMVPVSLAGRTPKEAHFWLKHNRVRRAGAAMPNPGKADAE